MPTYGQRAFVQRALESLLAQSFPDWELLVVDDDSPDDTADLVARYAEIDTRIRLLCLKRNQGLGAALNAGLEQARAEIIAYLPSDDVYFRDHLANLVALLLDQPETTLAFSGVRYRRTEETSGQIPGESLQLVQVAHRRTPERWVERGELVTDDLERMYWGRLQLRGPFAGAGIVSCEWVDHPAQRHKAIRESAGGGLNPYRFRYQVHEPLRFQSSTGSATDEVALYRRFRDRPDTPPAPDSLDILLAGELAYNPERVLALEERGHRLRGLWTPDAWHFNTVGPLPFGHVAEMPRTGWRSELRRRPPDLIYALLNWQAVPFAHKLLEESRQIGVPFVWHFKEGPWLCLERGLWPKLVDLHTRSDGQIYSSPELRDWFETVLPGSVRNGRPHVLDGDLPKRDWLFAPRSSLLSATDGAVHTVVPGRPIGLHPEDLGVLARSDVHLHFYGDVNHRGWQPWVDEARAVAPRHLHLHPHVDQSRWVEEFSQYDAGWLHFLRSDNGGDLHRASWDDLNYPARMATLAIAGVPLLQRANSGALVASQNLTRERGIGVFVDDIAEVGDRLRDAAMPQMRADAWRQREEFTFDAHADGLLEFFRDVVASKAMRTSRFAAD